MSISSRLTLVVALALGAAACFDRSIADPPNSSGSVYIPITPPEALELSLESVGNGYVVLSWKWNGEAFAGNGEEFGFFVERASDPAGPWDMLAFTHATSVGDLETTLQRCYRVTARLSESPSEFDSEPSRPLCLGWPRY